MSASKKAVMDEILRDAQLCESCIENGNMEAGDMTKREKMALVAMHAILNGRTGFMIDCGTDNVAAWAVRCADKLLRQLEDPPDFTCDPLRATK